MKFQAVPNLEQVMHSLVPRLPDLLNTQVRSGSQLGHAHVNWPWLQHVNKHHL